MENSGSISGMLWKAMGIYGMLWKTADQSAESSGRLYDHFLIKGLKNSYHQRYTLHYSDKEKILQLMRISIVRIPHCSLK